jgi:hypothetical protein
MYLLNYTHFKKNLLRIAPIGLLVLKSVPGYDHLKTTENTNPGNLGRKRNNEMLSLCLPLFYDIILFESSLNFDSFLTGVC